MYAISLEQAENLLQRFATSTLPKAEWTHEAHLIVGLKMTRNGINETILKGKLWAIVAQQYPKIS